MPRLKVLEAIHHSPCRHLSAEDIYRRLLETHEEFALGAVYRALRQLERAGLVSRTVVDSERAVFRINDGQAPAPS